jgi:hypothetical protein
MEAIHAGRFARPKEMRRTVFEHIEVDYNRTRRRCADGYIRGEECVAKGIACGRVNSRREGSVEAMG